MATPSRAIQSVLAAMREGRTAPEGSGQLPPVGPAPEPSRVVSFPGRTRAKPVTDEPPTLA